MTNARLKGDLVSLKVPELTGEEISNIVEMRQDQTTLSLLCSGDTLSTTETTKKYIKDCMEDDRKYLFLIVSNAYTELAGMLDIRLGDRRIMNASFGIMIGEKYVGKGYGTEAIKLMEKFAFDELYIHRIDLQVLSTNERAIHVYESCGFKLCGTGHQAHWTQGKWHDINHMELLRDDYEKLYK